MISNNLVLETQTGAHVNIRSSVMASTIPSAHHSLKLSNIYLVTIKITPFREIFNSIRFIYLIKIITVLENQNSIYAVHKVSYSLLSFTFYRLLQIPSILFSFISCLFASSILLYSFSTFSYNSSFDLFFGIPLASSYIGFHSVIILMKYFLNVVVI